MRFNEFFFLFSGSEETCFEGSSERIMVPKLLTNESAKEDFYGKSV